MRKVQWIVSGDSHCAVIAALGGYVNLVATKRNYTVEFVSDYLEGTVKHEAPAEGLKDAKALSLAFGHSLLKESGCYRSLKTSVRRKDKKRGTA